MRFVVGILFALLAGILIVLGRSRARKEKPVKLLSILQKIGGVLAGAVSAEEAVIPVFVHNPGSTAVAAVIITVESELANVLQALGAQPQAAAQAKS